MNGYSVYMFNAFLISLVVMRPLMSLADRVGLTDAPGGRKRHESPTPVVGGLAVFLSFALTLAQVGDVPALGLLPGLALLVIVGAIDDSRGMAAPVKLCGQVAAALVVLVPASLVLSRVGDPLGTGNLTLGVLAWPVSIVFVVAVINAFNLIDGIDGAAGGIALTSIGWLAAVAAVPRPDVMIVALIVGFAVLGFLVYNIRHPWRQRAEAFLGDAGSMFLGAATAVFVIELASGDTGADGTLPIPLVALLWTIALPGIDMASLVVRRLMRRRSPFAADRRHIHHLLLDTGLSVRSSAFVLIGANTLCGGVGIVGHWLAVPEPLLFSGLIVPALLHAYFVVHGARLLRQTIAGGRVETLRRAVRAGSQRNRT